MKESTFKKLFIGTSVVGFIGLVCLIIVMIEGFQRDVSPAWVNKVLNAGVIILIISIVLFVGIYLLSILLEKKNSKKPKIDENKILEQYKSKGKK